MRRSACARGAPFTRFALAPTVHAATQRCDDPRAVRHMLLACGNSRDQNIVAAMSRPLARTLVASFAVLLAPACTQDNPLFAVTSFDGGTTDASTSASTSASEPGLTATDPDTGLEGSGEGSSAPTTGSVDPGTTTTDATSTTTDPIETSTSTGEPPPDTSTGEPPPEPMMEEVVVVASLATCVLLPFFPLPYVGPLDCEIAAEFNDKVDEVGVMILDTAFFPAGSRSSRIYIRFEIPVAPVDRVLTSATLTLQASASPDAGAPWSGELFLSDPFDAAGLKVFAPAGIVLTEDPGPSVPDQPSNWQIPPVAVVPNQPLYLGLGPLGTDGVLFRSSRASEDKKPRLTLIYQ